VDFAVSTKLRHGVEWNLPAANLNNKHYYETKNYHNSRITPASPAEVRIHGKRRVTRLALPPDLPCASNSRDFRMA
jgi:hypothetical protein